MVDTVNYPIYTTDTTVQIFDNFYKFSATVNSTDYDVIYSYLRSVYDSEYAAANFTVTLFRVSDYSGIPVMTLFQQLQGKSAPQLTVTLAYYLNSVRSPCTLLGVSQPIQPNWYAARNCVA